MGRNENPDVGGLVVSPFLFRSYQERFLGDYTTFEGGGEPKTPKRKKNSYCIVERGKEEKEVKREVGRGV